MKTEAEIEVPDVEVTAKAMKSLSKSRKTCRHVRHGQHQNDVNSSLKAKPPGRSEFDNRQVADMRRNSSSYSKTSETTRLFHA